MTIFSLLIIVLWLSQNNAVASTLDPQVKCLNNETYEKIVQTLKEPEDPAKITVLYAHGFGGNGTAGKALYTKGNEHLLSYFYQDKKTDFKKFLFLFDTTKHNVITFNFADILFNLGIYGSIPNPVQTALAQEDDIRRLSQALNDIANQTIIGFGVSRGAATWITTLGTQKIQKNLACLILESPFAHAKNLPLFQLTQNALEVVKPLFNKINPKKHTTAFFNSIFQSYNFKGVQPLEVVHALDKQVPILLIHSKKDGIIPIDHSRELYIKLRQTEHEQVFLLELDHGDHANLLHGPHGELYCNVVHAFYKLCKLPCESERADRIDLKEFQPSIEQVLNLLKEEKKPKSKDQEKENNSNNTLSWSYSFNTDF